MAQKSRYISGMYRPNMLYGTIIRSPINRGRITSIDIPPMGDDVVVVRASDIPGSNGLRILKETLPLLTGETIHYLGQPILAVFAPTLEDAKVHASSVAIQFDTIPPDMEDRGIFTDRTVTHGDIDKALMDHPRVVERSYLTRELESSYTAPTGALSYPEDDRVIIHASTQWPFHVRDSVAEVCGLQKRRISVYTTPYSPNYGEKLVYPSMYACLTALASIKSGRPARLISRFPALSPRITVLRKTALDESGIPCAEDILVTADVGAYPLFAEEITEHLRCGVMGYIPLDHYRIRVKTLHSPHPPRYHFDGFGYPSALFSSESHISEICYDQEVNPAQWRLNQYTSQQLHLLNGASMGETPLEEVIQRVVKESAFNRKFAVCKINQVQRSSHASFRGYLRGIGIASGFAPNGFSRNYPWEKLYSVQVRLDENNRLSIHTSLCNSGASYTWRRTSSEILGIPEENIEVVYGGTRELPNSGPHILSRDISIITPLIRRCCESIKSQRFKEPLPIIVKRGFKAKSHEPIQEFHRFKPFTTACWGAVVVELEVDSVSFMPEFRGIWCAIDCGRLFNEEVLRNNLRTKLLKILHLAVGGRITPDYMPKVEIQFVDRGSSVPLSGSQVLVGLFYAAFTSALSQALDRSITELPITPPDILAQLEDL